MWESIWPDAAIDGIKAVLAGGASLAFQWVVPKALQVLGRARERRRARATAQGEQTAERQRVERRLAAILAADVAGYSRLTETDEEGTHCRLMEVLRVIVSPIIDEHRGRIVKSTGDGALVEFGSVVDAVRCAIKVQRVLAVRNASVGQDHRIELRLGVNLGDVIVEPDDIYGNGVNVAVRLEGLAAPGGICLTADAWRCVRGKIAAQVIDLGELRLKNITEPAHVFAIRPAIGIAQAPETAAAAR